MCYVNAFFYAINALWRAFQTRNIISCQCKVSLRFTENLAKCHLKNVRLFCWNRKTPFCKLFCLSYKYGWYCSKLQQKGGWNAVFRQAKSRNCQWRIPYPSPIITVSVIDFHRFWLFLRRYYCTYLPCASLTPCAVASYICTLSFAIFPRKRFSFSNNAAMERQGKSVCKQISLFCIIFATTWVWRKKETFAFSKACCFYVSSSPQICSPGFL